MKNVVRKTAKEYVRERRMRKRWHRVAAGLSCVVMLCTTYGLMLPAITLESEFFCGLAEHTHDDQCYEQKLICGLQEGEIHTHSDACYGTETERILICDQHTHTDACYEVKTEITLTCDQHVHDDTCYQVETKLVCEQETHVHSDECYEENGELVCQQHVHDESCYQETKTLICGQDGHEHTDACYTTTETKTLICGEAGDHTHSDACYEERPVLICRLEAGVPHVHTDACYEKTLTCEQEEHTHTLTCRSDPTAGVETAEVWEQTLPEELAGVWADDLLAVAQSQLAYTESTANFAVAEDEETITGYYTRYGAWYGDPYGDWCAMFVSFCLHYAQIPTDAVPQEADAARWVKKLSGEAQDYEAYDLYRAADDIPTPGDLVFFDTDQDDEADRVGIVTDYSPAAESSGTTLGTIQGDCDGQVREVTYDLDRLPEDLAILGYAELPEKPAPLCGKEEHIHTEDCYGPADENGESPLLCGLEAHIHTEECYVPQEREYRYEDAAVLVNVVLPGDSQVPETAVLWVTSITQEEERYPQLAQQARDAVEGTLEQLILYDVSFYTEEGEYLSVEDSAVVTITFKQGGLSAPAEQVTVLHYAQEEAAPVVLDEVEVQRDENRELSGLTFKTEGFSTYAIATSTYSDEGIAAYADTAGDLTLYPGQTYTADIDTLDLTNSNPDIASAVAAKVDAAKMLKLGTPPLFADSRASIEEALFRFTSTEDATDTYVITSVASASDSTTVYLNPPSSAEASYPCNTTPSTTEIKESNISDGFYLYTSSSTTGVGARYLYFYRDGENQFQFDRWANNVDGVETQCTFLLYRPVSEGETGSTEIPGYVRVTELDEIVDGQYLIAAVADGGYYVLYPNTNTTSGYGSAAKVVPYELTITAEAAGTTTVTAGDTELTVTVTDEIKLNEGDETTITLPAGDWSVADNDTDIATVEIDSETGVATITGVGKGTTTATITLGDKSYTWNITVSRVSFKLTYGENVVIFRLVDKNGNPLESDAIENIEGKLGDRYIFSDQDTSADGETVHIILPKIAGYTFQSVATITGTNPSPMTSVYSVGPVLDTNNNNKESLRFYQSNLDGFYTRTGEYTVTLTYEPNPITTIANPTGTVINLFDYWVTDVDEGQVNGDDPYPEEGINAGHALKFNSGSSDVIGTLNKWTGKDGGVLQEMVSSQLGADGYPVLSGDKQVEGSNSKESLAYLFDPDYVGDSAMYRQAYYNVGGLLQVDQNGYYYYDSTQNYAQYDGTTNRFTLYPDWAVQYNDGNQGEFFPFDAYRTVSHSTDASSIQLNHFFGLTLTTRFFQQNNGYTDASGNTPTTFEFSGDDDVWIFIDDVLVADLGGIHDAASVKINFAEGTVTISKVYSVEGADIVTPFANINGLTDGGKTLPNNTWHTLKFYYLERGGNASNLKLQYNLTTTPVTGIYKVNQYGHPVQGAKFAVYAADAGYSYLFEKNGAQVTLPKSYTYDDAGNICSSEDNSIIVKALYSGTTDATGQMVFMDKDGNPYSLGDLQERFGERFILKEIAVPDGYRMVSDEVYLYIYSNESNDNQMLLCKNAYQSGTWAAPTLQVTITEPTLTLFKGSDTDETVDPSSGTIFAVVLKYTGTDGSNLEDASNWSPIYGTASKGYTIVDVQQDFGNNFIAAAIDTAKRYVESNNVFTMNSVGQMVGGLDGMPGDISKYYNMLGADEKDQTQYTVAYYWSEGVGWDNINAKNTYRINDSNFSRVFGASIQVPNMINRLFVQKMDDEGELVNGAGFAMYNVREDPDGSGIYYVDGNENLVFLAPDDDGDNQGAAWLPDGSAENGGTYTVDGESGIITARIGDAEYVITPVEAQTTRYQAEEYGTAIFTDLATGGYYYVREISAPEGYHLNPAQVMVRVTDDAILANAGSVGDGVVVARGPGYLATTMDQFASEGQVDNTLTWILTQLRISDESSTFDGTDKDSYYESWQYITSNYCKGSSEVTINREGAIASYLKYDPSAANTIFNYTVNTDRKDPEPADSLTRRLYTDVGWSYLEIYQDYEYGVGATSSGANYMYLEEKEISNLFSRSVYIQVTDQKADLEISKTVENAPADTNDAFAFRVDLYSEDDKTPLTGSYNYKIYPLVDEDDGTVSRGTAISSDTITSGDIITLQDHQVAVIEDLPYGSRYAITETGSTKYSTTAKQKGSDPYTFQIGEAKTVSDTLYWNADDGIDNVTTVDFTNTYLPELQIRKVKKGDANVTLEGAEFTLSYTGEDNITYYYSAAGWKTQAELLRTGTDGLISLYLPDGTYTLTETKAPNGYLPLAQAISFTVEKGQMKNQNLPDGVTLSGDGLTLTVPNEGGYKLPETGGSGTAVYSLAGIACMMTACLWLTLRKRRA